MKPSELDSVIHAPKRLAAMSILSATETASFAYLREQLDLSDSDLSKQMAALQQAGYVGSRRHGTGRNKANWYRLTRAGRKAYDAHIVALRELIDQQPPAADRSGDDTVIGSL